jgi:aminopeptidase N
MLILDSVWQQILVSLGNIRSIFSDVEDVSKGLTAFTLKLVTPATDKIGLEFPPGEDLLTGQLRALLVGQAGLAGHKGVIEVAQARFAAFTSGKDTSAIHPSLRSPFFRIAVTEGGKEAYEAVKDFHKTTASIDGKEIALQSLGRVQTDELANDYLNFLFSDAVAVQDMHTGASSLGRNSKTRLALWKYIKANWDSKIFPDLSGNIVVLERFLRMSLSKFASYEVKKDIDSFFAGKDNKGYDRGLGVIADTVEGSAQYKERDTAVVREWLSVHGYL